MKPYFSWLLLLAWSCRPGVAPSRLSYAPVQRLSQASLYTDIATKEVAPEHRPFTPRFELWSDGGEKRRWIYLPEGARIDATDPDHWIYPIGTTVYKEFSYLGRRIETRELEKLDEGLGPTAWSVSVFLWREDESEADRVSHGAEDVAPTPFGTRHDVPSVDDCAACHDSGGDMLLGFTSVQLGGEGEGLRLADLAREDRLTVTHPEPRLPEDPALAEVTGMLHANCAACHNPLSANPGSATGLYLHLPAELTGEPPFLATGRNKLTTRFEVPQRRLGVDSLVIEAGSAAHSALSLLSSRRGAGQMPPLATEAPDAALGRALSAYLDSL